MSLPSTVHVSSTLFLEPHECHFLALFMHRPPKEFGAMLLDCLVWTLYCNPPFSTFFRRPMNLLPSAVHVSSTFKSGAPQSYCIALFANSPFSTFFSEPHEFIA